MVRGGSDVTNQVAEQIDDDGASQLTILFKIDHLHGPVADSAEIQKQLEFKEIN